MQRAARPRAARGNHITPTPLWGLGPPFWVGAGNRKWLRLFGEGDTGSVEACALLDGSHSRQGSLECCSQAGGFLVIP